ncbi:four helix bundle protein [Marixanthomonas spongiae]|uniref:four helix bundle protein n=1 Tax=Marixanthomonas spongiae TaxID=2174845 RepID=UPI0029372E76|nr:four helix bundle protein [Marixanthomonas spongiae]
MKIWQKALNIAFEISDKTENFPSKEQYSLTSQINRCSISMPSNIAEGSARTEKSFIHFIDIAMGSSYELNTQLLIAHHKKYISGEELNILETQIEEWQRMTAGFQKTL